MRTEGGRTSGLLSHRLCTAVIIEFLHLAERDASLKSSSFLMRRHS